MKKNLFIALEGIDGSGKTTQMKLLADALQKSGHSVYATAEPSGRPIGRMIRDIFNRRWETNHQTIASLFLADRLDHLQNQEDGLLRKIRSGQTVICDRYYFSSYAYHSVYMDMDWVIRANSVCADLLRPDLNIMIDVDPQESMKRLSQTRSSIEIYETLENLQKVRKCYFQAIEKLKDEEKMVVIDGNRFPEEIHQDIIKELEIRDFL